MKILFCTDKIEWQDLVARQRIGDCLWIHIPHWGLCDPPLSSHQTFLPEVELRQCVFCNEPLLFWFSSRRRNFGLSGSDYTCCAPSILTRLLEDVPDLIPEKCVRMQAILWPPDFLWNALTRMAYLLTDLLHLSCHHSEIPALVSWWQVRHFDLILNPKMNLMQLCFQRLVLLLF